MPGEDDTQENLQASQDEISEQGERPERQDLVASAPRHSGASYRKLATIVAIIAILLGLVLSTYKGTQTKKSPVVYAKRYSKEHKFRPAASPIVTETLKDGRVRIRGAEPTMSAPKPTVTKRKRKARRTTRKKAPKKKGL